MGDDIINENGYDVDVDTWYYVLCPVPVRQSIMLGLCFR